ncbi:MAG TPA: hypothetical protein VNY55_08005 [Mycobacterium sp.]|jgi:hypothetical protein|nr:hypothetical protein [Mycobacterium sp.]
MNDLERHNCDLFVRSLSLLHVNDDGLTGATSFDDVKAIAQVCPEIRDITAAGDVAKKSPDQGVCKSQQTTIRRLLGVSEIFRQRKPKWYYHNAFRA